MNYLIKYAYTKSLLLMSDLTLLLYSPGMGTDNPCHYYFNGCGALSMDPDEDEEQVIPTLNLLRINYNIKEFVGPWWKGACFRQRRTKTVLNNINVQFCSGELTAILGSSG
jgi:ABC-type glutathione transport system ATPase component